MHLLLNAIDALPRGGTITVTTRVVGASAEVIVADTGVGMSPETRRRAFEPFFTTKSLRHTGLGLSAAYGIVTRYRGELTIESEEERGTAVTVRLPVAVTAATTKPPAVARGTGSLRILLVDDEDEVRDALALVLRGQGARRWIISRPASPSISCSPISECRRSTAGKWPAGRRSAGPTCRSGSSPGGATRCRAGRASATPSTSSSRSPSTDARSPTRSPA